MDGKIFTFEGSIMLTDIAETPGNNNPAKPQDAL
jgi:hypothetical protein